MKYCAIGCGRHARYAHGPSQKKIASERLDLELSACCDLNEALAESYRDDFGFLRCYRDMDTMLDKEKPDAVSLVVPPDLTNHLAIRILERGIPLLLEKPPALNQEELRKLILGARKGGGLTQVAFNRRYMPNLRKGLELLEQRLLPESVLQINYEMSRYNRVENHFLTTAVHAIDALLYLARSPYKEVEINYRELPECGEGVVAFSLNGEFESGTRFRLDVQPTAGIIGEKLSCHGMGESLCIDLFGPKNDFSGLVEYWKSGSLIEAYQPTGQLIEKNGTYGETLAFIDAVNGMDVPLLELEQCVQQIEIMEAIGKRLPEVSFA